MKCPCCPSPVFRDFSKLLQHFADHVAEEDGQCINGLLKENSGFSALLLSGSSFSKDSANCTKELPVRDLHPSDTASQGSSVIMNGGSGTGHSGDDSSQCSSDSSISAESYKESSHSPKSVDRKLDESSKDDPGEPLQHIEERIKFYCMAEVASGAGQEKFVEEGGIKVEKFCNGNAEADVDPLSLCSVTMEEDNENDDTHIEPSVNAPTTPNELKCTTNIQDELKCTQCPKVYPSKRALSIHMLNHKKTFYKCRDCTSIFQSHSQLKAHVSMVHCGNTPSAAPRPLTSRYNRRKLLLCPYCSKSFGWCTDLKRHILIHTGERPFKCPFCNADYNRKFLLENHIRSKHPGCDVKASESAMKKLDTKEEEEEEAMPRLEAQEITEEPTDDSLSVEKSPPALEQQSHVEVSVSLPALSSSSATLPTAKRNLKPILRPAIRKQYSNRRSKIKANDKLDALNSISEEKFEFECEYCSEKFHYRAQYLCHVLTH